MFNGKIIVSDTEDGVEKLRADDTFVEDEGRHARFRLYADFLDRHRHARTLFMDPGIGMNTPALCAMRSKRRKSTRNVIKRQISEGSQTSIHDFERWSA